MTLLSVATIAILAGVIMGLLRRMHDKAATATAAETIIQRGHTMVSHLVSQLPLSEDALTQDWARLSQFARNLHSIESGLQYLSLTRDGMVVFFEQTSIPETLMDMRQPTPIHVPEIIMRRERIQTGTDDIVPVVVFSAPTHLDGSEWIVEVAMQTDAVSREARAAGTAISSMFRLSLLTISAAFGTCMALILFMLRREGRHAAMRAEQEHLAFSGMVANGIVHDFRNPMSSMKLDAQMLVKEVDRDEQQRPERTRQLAQRIAHTLDRMDEVFHAFLYGAKPDSGEPTTIDLSSCLHDVLQTMQSRLERASLQVHLDLPDAPLHVTVFTASLHRALANLLINAIDFSPNGGTLTLRMHAHGNEAILELEDQGPGIPAKDRDRVFDKFITTRPEGTGLGLFLARTAIQRCGGSIALHDATHPPGTRIRITLPLAKQASMA